MKYLSFLFYTILVGCFLGCNQTVSQEGLTHVDSKEFQLLIEREDVQLIDVRKPEEFSQGHIPNAINIDYLSDDFVASINKLNPQKPVYIYCHSELTCRLNCARSNKIFSYGFKPSANIKALLNPSFLTPEPPHYSKLNQETHNTFSRRFYCLKSQHIENLNILNTSIDYTNLADV